MLWFIFHLENQKEISTQTHARTHTQNGRASAAACGWREMAVERKHTNFFFHYGFFVHILLCLFFVCPWVSSIAMAKTMRRLATLALCMRVDDLYTQTSGERQSERANEHSACANDIGSCFSSSFGVCFLLSPFVRLFGRSFVRSFYTSSFNLSQKQFTADRRLVTKGYAAADEDNHCLK